MTQTTTRTIKGETVPVLGLGTFGLTGPEGENAIRSAIDLGYRQIDTAIRYGNETEVGRAIRAVAWHLTVRMRPFRSALAFNVRIQSL